MLFVPALLLLLTAASDSSVEAGKPRRFCQAAPHNHVITSNANAI